MSGPFLPFSSREGVVGSAGHSSFDLPSVGTRPRHHTARTTRSSGAHEKLLRALQGDAPVHRHARRRRARRRARHANRQHASATHPHHIPRVRVGAWEPLQATTTGFRDGHGSGTARAATPLKERDAPRSRRCRRGRADECRQTAERPRPRHGHLSDQQRSLSEACAHVNMLGSAASLCHSRTVSATRSSASLTDARLAARRATRSQAHRRSTQGLARTCPLAAES